MNDYVGYQVDAIKCYEKYDFAIGMVQRPVELVLPLMPAEDCLAGIDVMAYGVNTNGIKGQQLDLLPRLMKGHIVRVGGESTLSHAKVFVKYHFHHYLAFQAPLYCQMVISRR